VQIKCFGSIEVPVEGRIYWTPHAERHVKGRANLTKNMLCDEILEF
jgi:hypothetical protein